MRVAVELLIDKTARRLSALECGREVFSCRVALGRAPIGHKEREGDGRTPEGEYLVVTRNAQSKYYKVPWPFIPERGRRARRTERWAHRPGRLRRDPGRAGGGQTSALGRPAGRLHHDPRGRHGRRLDGGVRLGFRPRHRCAVGDMPDRNARDPQPLTLPASRPDTKCFCAKKNTR